MIGALWEDNHSLGKTEEDDQGIADKHAEESHNRLIISYLLSPYI